MHGALDLRPLAVCDIAADGFGLAFDGLQIEAFGLAQPGKDDVQQLLYFAGDFLTDRFRRFFSCEVSGSSMGSNWQIFSFTSIKSRLI